MTTIDIRNSFCDPLVALIEAHAQGGYAYIPNHKVRALITEATRHRDEFFPAFTDAEVARIISDSRIDWRQCFSADGTTTRNISLLSDLLLHMPMAEYVTWLPLTQSALNERYSIAHQVEILKQSEAAPGYSGNAIEARQMLSGRIVPLILQDQEHLDVWVTEWMKALKFQERVGPRITKTFSESVQTTRAYRKLSEGQSRMEALSVLMPFACLLEPNAVMKSVARYCDASLYQLSSPEHSGLFFNTTDDYLRRTLVYGLYLLRDEGLEEMVSMHIGHQVIQDRHLDLAAALLASSINWHRELIDIDALCKIQAKYETRDAVDVLLSKHAFGWDRDWFKKVGEIEHCSDLRKHVGSFESFRKWVLEYASNSRFASMSTMKQLPDWIELMSEDDRNLSFAFLSKQFKAGITVKHSNHGTGIFYGKVMLSAFPDEPFAQACISDEVGYLVKRALKDDHTELLAAVIEKGFVTPEMVARCVWNVKEFNQLTRPGNLAKKLLLPFVTRKVKVGVLEEDLGM
jgi:hypothetical protein